VVRKICLAALLMSIAGIASASARDSSCITFWGFTLWCPPGHTNAPPAKTPEIDPASAMAGLTLLAGGLAVLRGRRSKKTEK
jgi:hypothetical protein